MGDRTGRRGFLGGLLAAIMAAARPARDSAREDEVPLWPGPAPAVAPFSRVVVRGAGYTAAPTVVTTGGRAFRTITMGGLASCRVVRTGGDPGPCRP